MLKPGFKKLLLLSCLTVVASQKAFANSNAYGQIMLGGSFARAGWGGVNSIAAVNDRQLTQIIFQTSNPEGTKNVSNFAGRALVGYELVGEQLSLAFELGGTFREKTHFNQEDFRSIFQNTNDLGIPAEEQINSAAAYSLTNASLVSEFNVDFKPGIYVSSKFLLYGRAGLAFTKLHLTDSGAWYQTATSTGSSDPLSISARGFSTVSIERIGQRIGFGLEYCLSARVRATIDYAYTNFGNITTRSDGMASSEYIDSSYFQVVGIDQPSLNIRTNTVMAGLRYNFNDCCTTST